MPGTIKIRDDIQFVRRLVVAPIVAAIVCPPNISCHRVKVEPLSIPNTISQSPYCRAVGVGRNHRPIRSPDVASVARRVNRRVNAAIRTHIDVFPSMRRTWRALFNWSETYDNVKNQTQKPSYTYMSNDKITVPGGSWGRKLITLS